ncbi:hypothetical protein [Candidatus Babela massiliensis]|uniref:Uncharacterized protein n=1 Tax=Candidatus Babela massiliensis TaxID=673862 RepID=V6DIR1_9BACT|nr:hypothetical protein [Candidatus Babela massiliensis]CDK30818.1 hypothetical protein BABL1_gene_197 [Candidatus Babela massiliensis]
MKKNISILLVLLLFNHPSYTMHSSKSLEDCQDSSYKSQEGDNQIT